MPELLRRPRPRPRPLAIRVQLTTFDGERTEHAWDHGLARPVLHEIDHLHGTLARDLVHPGARQGAEAVVGCRRAPPLRMSMMGSWPSAVVASAIPAGSEEAAGQRPNHSLK
jgi:hypothetical protein